MRFLAITSLLASSLLLTQSAASDDTHGSKHEPQFSPCDKKCRHEFRDHLAVSNAAAATDDALENFAAWKECGTQSWCTDAINMIITKSALNAVANSSVIEPPDDDVEYSKHVLHVGNVAALNAMLDTYNMLAAMRKDDHEFLEKRWNATNIHGKHSRATYTEWVARRPHAPLPPLPKPTKGAILVPRGPDKVLWDAGMLHMEIQKPSFNETGFREYLASQEAASKTATSSTTSAGQSSLPTRHSGSGSAHPSASVTVSVASRAATSSAATYSTPTASLSTLPHPSVRPRPSHGFPGLATAPQGPAIVYATGAASSTPGNASWSLSFRQGSYVAASHSSTSVVTAASSSHTRGAMDPPASVAPTAVSSGETVSSFAASSSSSVVIAHQAHGNHHNRDNLMALGALGVLPVGAIGYLVGYKGFGKFLDWYNKPFASRVTGYTYRTLEKGQKTWGESSEWLNDVRPSEIFDVGKASRDSMAENHFKSAKQQALLEQEDGMPKGVYSREFPRSDAREEIQARAAERAAERGAQLAQMVAQDSASLATGASGGTSAAMVLGAASDEAGAMTSPLEFLASDLFPGIESASSSSGGIQRALRHPAKWNPKGGDDSSRGSDDGSSSDADDGSASGSEEGSPHYSPAGSEDGSPHDSPAGSEEGSPHYSPAGSEEGSPHYSPAGSEDGGPNDGGSDDGSSDGSDGGSLYPHYGGSDDGSSIGSEEGSPHYSPADSEDGSEGPETYTGKGEGPARATPTANAPGQETAVSGSVGPSPIETSANAPGEQSGIQTTVGPSATPSGHQTEEPSATSSVQPASTWQSVKAPGQQSSRLSTVQPSFTSSGEASTTGFPSNAKGQESRLSTAVSASTSSRASPTSKQLPGLTTLPPLVPSALKSSSLTTSPPSTIPTDTPSLSHCPAGSCTTTHPTPPPTPIPSPQHEECTPAWWSIRRFSWIIPPKNHHPKYCFYTNPTPSHNEAATLGCLPNFRSRECRAKFFARDIPGLEQEPMPKEPSDVPLECTDEWKITHEGWWLSPPETGRPRYCGLAKGERAVASKRAEGMGCLPHFGEERCREMFFYR